MFELVADPVRLAIVRQLSATVSAPLVDIAERAGVHHNTVRSHMSALEAAGVVERERAASEGPGRPQVRYRLGAGWRLPSSDMRGLSELLAVLALRLGPSPETVHELGRHWGRYVAGQPGGASLDGLPRLLESLGFDAEVDRREIRLRSCPCPLVSAEHPELICRLAGAAVDGLAEVAPGGLRVSGAEHDPARRRCTIHLSDRPRPRSVRPPVRVAPAPAA